MVNIPLESPWIRVADIVPPTSSKVVWQSLLNNFRTTKIEVTLYNKAEGQTRSFEAKIDTNGTTITTQVYARQGVTPQVSFNPIVNAGSLELGFENFNSFAVTVEMVLVELGY